MNLATTALRQMLLKVAGAVNPVAELSSFPGSHGGRTPPRLPRRGSGRAPGLQLKKKSHHQHQNLQTIISRNSVSP